MKLAMAPLAFAMVAALAFVLSAQDQTPQQNGENKAAARTVAIPLKEMLDQLDLTGEQKAKINALTTEFSKKVKQVAAEINAIFTAEQKKIRNETIKAAIAEGKTDRAEIAKAVSDAVKLTDEQKEKMQSLNQGLLVAQREMVAKVKELLTPEQSEQLRNLVEKHATAKAKDE